MKQILNRISAVRAAMKERDGFTLIEIMIVVTIIAILSSLIVPRVLDYPKKAKVTAAKMQINEFKLPLLEYSNITGNYPSTEEGLEALVQEKLIKKIPKDPWGNEYQYRFPGEFDTSEYEIWSYGADGQDGGEDYNADIKSWE